MQTMQTILDQSSCDESVFALPAKVQEVYEFLLEKDTLEYINTKGHILVEIAQVVGNCAEFIAKYSQRKDFGTPFVFPVTPDFSLDITSVERLGKRFLLDTQS